MLDEFVWGDVSRISPEAPVPVVEIRRESVHLGGAANVLAEPCCPGSTGLRSRRGGKDTARRTSAREFAQRQPVAVRRTHCD